MGLEQWGASEQYYKIASGYPEYELGRVISQEKDLFRVVMDKEECTARVSGKFRYNVSAISEFPSVGDFVLIEHSFKDDVAVIHKVLPRKSVFIRKAAGKNCMEQVVAANIDTIFLCMALNRDFNIRRLERYLSIAWDSGAVPVIILTKIDLCDDLQAKRFEIENVAVGVPVMETSGLTGDGLQQIKQYLQKTKTVAFIGSSGVGKSTLINRLLGEECLKTNTIRKDDKGRHTTTHRELFLLPDRGMVIDTPGMRELGMWKAEEGIEHTFSDIEKLAEKCRFHNCTHTSEPECAVRAAMEDGIIDEERLKSYKKLKAENSYMEDAESYMLAKKKKISIQDIAAEPFISYEKNSSCYHAVKKIFAEEMIEPPIVKYANTSEEIITYASWYNAIGIIPKANTIGNNIVFRSFSSEANRFPIYMCWPDEKSLTYNADYLLNLCTVYQKELTDYLKNIL